MTIDGVMISDGNTKLGAIPNISLYPGPKWSCRPDAPCWKACYARKFVWLRKAVQRAWVRNLVMAWHNPDQYFTAIRKYLAKKKPARFRFHVGGDILGAAYLDQMILTACHFPKTKFVAFTKRYELFEKPLLLPSNLTVVFSAWPGLPLPESWAGPVGWMFDKKKPDPRIPKDARHCPGHCEKCWTCWTMETGQSVVFAKH